MRGSDAGRRHPGHRRRPRPRPALTHRRSTRCKAIHRLVVREHALRGTGVRHPRLQALQGRRRCSRAASATARTRRRCWWPCFGSVGVDAELVLLRTRRGGRIDRDAGVAGRVRPRHRLRAQRSISTSTARPSSPAWPSCPPRIRTPWPCACPRGGAKLVRTPLLPRESNQALRVAGGLARRRLRARRRKISPSRDRPRTSGARTTRPTGERRERYAKVWSGRFAGATLAEVDMDVADRNRPVAVSSTVTVPQIGER